MDDDQEKTMSRMFTPPHPSATLREDILPALGLTVTDAALELQENGHEFRLTGC
jgi:hypothetical protein